MRTTWIMFCDVRGSGTRVVVRKWDGAYDDVRSKNQTVFSMVFSCGLVAMCVDKSTGSNTGDAQKIEVVHCGSYLERYERLKWITGE